jgi:protein-tyrosine kinase
MSMIEEGLRKVQANDSQAGRIGRSVDAHRGIVPTATRKKVVVEGKKHHISLEDLIEAGLLAPLHDAGSVAVEFRRMKRPLIVNASRGNSKPGEHMNSIMLASPLPGAGKTFCSVNLAVSISLERELNVVLVDADVPKPHITREFGLTDSPGLIDLLLDETLDVGSALVRTDLNDIQVLPAGRRHPQATELLASERMSRVVHELAVRYPDRIILVDSPPLLVTSEAQVLATQVGQIVLIVEAGQTSQQVLVQAVEQLDESKAITLILNKARRWQPDSYYSGEYSYGEYGAKR